MRFPFTPIVCGLVLAATPCFGLTRIHHTKELHASIRHASFRSHRVEHEHVAVVHHEAPAMDSDRASQIQAALIKAGYMSGEPTGTWNAGSIAAMEKLQADHGWQTKLVPDSRALIQLGLGPQDGN